MRGGYWESTGLYIPKRQSRSGRRFEELGLSNVRFAPKADMRARQIMLASPFGLEHGGSSHADLFPEAYKDRLSDGIVEFVK